MGISTLQSYCGAQIFEALGLSQAFVDKYFTWTPTRIEGIGARGDLSRRCRRRHQRAFPDRAATSRTCSVAGGDYQWRHDGERHLFKPQTIHKLQTAVRMRDGEVWTSGFKTFKEYSGLVNDAGEGVLHAARAAGTQAGRRTRSRWTRWSRSSAIVKRFKTGAMSYGSISQEAHETMAIAMNRIGGRSNTGEGGEDPARYHLDATNGRLARTARSSRWRRAALA